MPVSGTEECYQETFWAVEVNSSFYGVLAQSSFELLSLDDGLVYFGLDSATRPETELLAMITQGVAELAATFERAQHVMCFRRLSRIPTGAMHCRCPID